MEKLKKWFNRNRSEIATITLFISAILSCANLFSGIGDIGVTTITCCMTSIGIIILIYDHKKEVNNEN